MHHKGHVVSAETYMEEVFEEIQEEYTVSEDNADWTGFDSFRLDFSSFDWKRGEPEPMVKEEHDVYLPETMLEEPLSF
jgi:hypothetical protein